MAKKRLTDYSDTEIEQLKDIVLKSASFGFTTKQAATLIGISVPQLTSLMDKDEEFNTKFHSARQGSIEKASSKMHELASKGSYQALSFILSKDANSPYHETNIDPKQSEALNILLGYLVETQGLLPPEHYNCPRCNCHIVLVQGKVVALDKEERPPEYLIN
jgi:hypothetical protein